MDKDILKIDLGAIRDVLISEGRYNIHKNKIIKSKKSYTRKKKHKKPLMNNQRFLILTRTSNYFKLAIQIFITLSVGVYI